MKSIKHIITCCALMILIGMPAYAQEFVYDEKGYPDQKTVENLFDEMDYQRAVQAYLWAIAPMAVAGQHNMNRHFGATENFDFLVNYDDAGVVGMLTPNTIVKYAFNFVNLKACSRSFSRFLR